MGTYQTATSVAQGSERAFLDQTMATLSVRKEAWARLAVSRRSDLLRQVRNNLALYAQGWVETVHLAKELKPNSIWAAEEWYEIFGLARALDAYIRALDRIAAGRLPLLKRVKTRANGQVVVQVFPEDIYDWLLFNGMSVEVWMLPGVTVDNLEQHMGGCYGMGDTRGRTTLVLGAGNVNSIPALDALYRLIVCGHVVLLKLSPVNDYLQPLLQMILAPFIEKGFLAIVNGGADVGGYLARHEAIDEVHLTGSAHTFDLLKEGPDALNKPMTGELGGVTPVIVAPGHWSLADLRFQAENVATMKLFNNGFNCIAAQVLVLPAEWPQRNAFVEMIRQSMRTLPAGPAFFPGVVDRQRAALVAHPDAELLHCKPTAYPPRTLIANLTPEASVDICFRKELFGPVLGVVTLPGATPSEFMAHATAFCNEKLFGTLAAEIIAHPQTLHALGTKLDETLAALRYGAIGVNMWSGAIFRIAQAPWGAYQSASEPRTDSGAGVVHNALLFDHPQKAITRGSFYPFPRSWRHGDLALLPRPPWFVTNKMRVRTSRQVAEFTLSPSPGRLAGLFLSALRG